MSIPRINTKSATGTTLAKVVIPADSKGGDSRWCMIRLDSVSDKAASVVKRTTSTLETKVVSHATKNKSGQADIAVESSAGFANGDRVIIQTGSGLNSTILDDLLDGSAGVPDSTTITLDGNLASDVAANSRVFLMDDSVSIPHGAAEKSFTQADGPEGSGILIGRPSKPMIIEIDGTSSVKIHQLQFYGWPRGSQ